MTDIHLVGGLETRVSSILRFRAAVQYERSRNQAIFLPEDSTGLFRPSYDDRVWSFGVVAGVEGRWAETDEGAASVTIRRTRRAGSDGSVPYVPDLLGELWYRHIFPAGFRAGASMELVGSRWTDLANQESLNAYLDIGLKAEYIGLPGFVFGVSVTNILGGDTTWWRGYAGTPASIEAELSYRW
jgi:hypothetical protein